MTKIGILGSGEVVKALSRAFMGYGYQVVKAAITQRRPQNSRSKILLFHVSHSVLSS
jgi:hypothetical protein